jgi:tRNA dimethylallyltransferase
MTKPQQAVVCILGPTATGKSALALQLAETLPSEIISVDSAMVYRGLDIGTAKPSSAELARCRHHLIDILDPSETYSAARFTTDATQQIKRLLKQQKLPILVGGTMLYFHALQRGLSQLPPTNPAVRAQLQQVLKRDGVETLHQRLQQADPCAAEKIHPHDPQRILRALEVYVSSGKTISSFWQQSAVGAQYDFINFAFMPADRQQLHQQIQSRFTQMLAQGFMAEVQRLASRKELLADCPALRTVGYRQALAHLAGEYDFDTMCEKVVVATRRLAKRQMTWLRQWPELHRLEMACVDNSRLIEKILKQKKGIL